jgi:co-chaperonin GroES (HSP10)
MKMLLIKPTPGHILIEILTERKTGSGLVLTDVIAEQSPMYGKVVEIGEDIEREKDLFDKSSARKGDVVIFRRHSEQELPEYSNENKLALIRFQDVLAIEHGS